MRMVASPRTAQENQMRSDTEIERDIQEEMRFSPDLDETDVSVKVQAGVVTLTGFVRNYFEKDRAEQAAKRVRGVVGLAHDIQVRVAMGNHVPDPEIARAAVAALRNAMPALSDQIEVIVSQGHVSLEGVELSKAAGRGGSTLHARRDRAHQPGADQAQSQTC
jgi:osmotically-inducible protein OsmY